MQGRSVFPAPPQWPYAWSQIRDCGLPAGHPPYPRPSAQTPLPDAGTRGRPDTVRVGSVTGGRGGGWAAGGTPPGGGTCGRDTGAGAPSAGAGADGEASGTASSASRAGGWPIWGSTPRTGPLDAGGGGGGVPGPPGLTVTQPDTVATATPTKAATVILVRCTR